MKCMAKRESFRGYKHVKCYDVLSIRGTEKLIKPLIDDNQKAKLYVHSQEQFDIPIVRLNKRDKKSGCIWQPGQLYRVRIMMSMLSIVFLH